MYTKYAALIQMMTADARLSHFLTAPIDPTDFPAIASMRNHNHELRIHAAVNAICSTPEYASELVPITPIVSSTDSYKLTPKADSKRPARKGVYKCKKCRKQFTVTVGTIFEGGHIPLSKWLMAINLMCASKKGMSAHQLHRTLGITYKTVWLMCHRIRYAMTQPSLSDKLNGIVEVDETYIGGKLENMHKNKRDRMEKKRGRGSENKTPVVALVERNGNVRAFKSKKVDGATLKSAIRKNVERDARIMTNSHPAYNGLENEFASHETVDHSQEEYVRGDVHTNTAEGWFSLLKRSIVGTFHHVSEHHFEKYVDESAFKYNNRKVNDAERTVKAIKGIEGKRLYYKEPIRE